MLKMKNYMRVSAVLALLIVLLTTNVFALSVESQYQVNENGETFGVSIIQAPEDEPDLIAAIATNGNEGYVRSADFLDEIAPPSGDASEIIIPEVYSIPVYKSDGTTVIGEFRVNDGLKVSTAENKMPNTTRSVSGDNHFTVYGNKMITWAEITGYGDLRLNGKVTIMNDNLVKHAAGNLGAAAHLYTSGGSLVQRGSVQYSTKSTYLFYVTNECRVVPGKYFCAGGGYVFNKGTGKYTMKETQWTPLYTVKL